MTEDRGVALADRVEAQAVEQSAVVPCLGDQGRPRRHDPEQELRRGGLLFIFLLGLYAVAFIVLGVGLTP